LIKSGLLTVEHLKAMLAIAHIAPDAELDTSIAFALAQLEQQYANERGDTCTQLIVEDDPSV